MSPASRRSGELREAPQAGADIERMGFSPIPPYDDMPLVATLPFSRSLGRGATQVL